MRTKRFTLSVWRATQPVVFCSVVGLSKIEIRHLRRGHLRRFQNNYMQTGAPLGMAEEKEKEIREETQDGAAQSMPEQSNAVNLSLIHIWYLTWVAWNPHFLPWIHEQGGLPACARAAWFPYVRNHHMDCRDLGAYRRHHDSGGKHSKRCGWKSIDQLTAHHIRNAPGLYSPGVFPLELKNTAPKR